MLLYTPFDPLTSFRDPFLLKATSNLLDYYKSKIRKSENLIIRHCLIDQATTKLKSGSCLIDQVAAISKSGSCLINQAATRVN